MQNTRLAALLRTFDRKEMRELRKFIATPFFNQRQDVMDLCELLAGIFHKNEPAPSKADAYRHLYGPAADYDDHRLRMTMSFLLKLAEQFLVHRAFFADEVAVKTKLAELYRQRKLPKHFDRAMRDAQAVQEGSAYRNAQFFRREYQLQFEQYRFNAGQQRSSELNLQSVTDHLDLAYFSQKIRQACLMVSHQTVYRTDYDFGLLDAILGRVETDAGLLEVPAVAVYFHCYRALTRPEEPAHFQQLKKMLVAEADKFPPSEVADLYLLAINFCIRRYNDGADGYLAAQFELYQAGLKRDIFLNNGVLSRFTYRNVVTVGLVRGAFEWVENFIHEFQDKLEPQHRDSMFSFSLARLEYERRNYGKALQMLQQGEYGDLLLNLAAKTVVLKIYFETDEFDALDSHLDAMQRFIRRKKIMGYHRENYLNLLQFVRKLVEAADREERATLRQEVEAVKAVAEREWLLGQCG